MDRKKIIRKSIKLLIPLLVEELTELLAQEKSRIWTRPWILRRPELGATNTIFSELQLEDPDEFRALLRMTVENFNTLLENITSMIQREDTVLREAIPARTKLQVALCYIVTGISYRYLQAFYRISRAAISLLIPEVMEAIYTYLESYLK
ncbi:Uncharacterized protein OBRU01_03436 [Operophtera brumata]|uniref:Nuclease HARBI1 n=1 Tax=Operophtera brumata TaxID=104452 RepID=A0A0L7LRL2_OPEBR|nr:Uncharacterized protein OBRU01_03436 [Operophtera brumata]